MQRLQSVQTGDWRRYCDGKLRHGHSQVLLPNKTLLSPFQLTITTVLLFILTEVAGNANLNDINKQEQLYTESDYWLINSVLIDKMNKLWITLLLLKLQLVYANFCSVLCLRNDCSNTSINGCTTCTTNWIPGGSTCVPDLANNYQQFDKSSDLGGSLNVQPNPLQTVCSYQIYPAPTALDTITVRSSSGIPQKFFEMTVYFGIFTVDAGINANTFWNLNNAHFFLRFSSGNGQNFVNSYPIMGPTYVIKKFLCSDSTKSEHWNKIIQSYTFSTSNVSLKFEINTNQTTGSNKWGIKQFIIIHRGCHVLCLTCYGGLNSQCNSCVYSAGTNSSWLSGTTCSASCLTNYGQSSSVSYCIRCDSRCTACYLTPTICSACTTSGLNTSFLYTSNSSCLASCPASFFANRVGQICTPCNVNCSTCIYNADYCTSCVTGFSWYNYVCYKPCPAGTFNNILNCSKCDVYCDLCVGSATLCTLCKTAGPFLSYLYNPTNPSGSCLRTCPAGFYASSLGGINLCPACDVSCAYCTGNPTPCQQCSPGYYFYSDACNKDCPAPLFPTNATGSGQCLDCNVVCADMNLSMQFSNSLSSQIYVDLVSSQSLNFSTFDYKNFQTITVTSRNLQYTLDMFDVSYKFLSERSYRIVLKPKGYIFLYNATFTATTKASTNTDFSAFGMPFKPPTYLQTASLVWFLIQGPPFSAFETNIMNSFDTLSQKTNDFLAKPYIQEIKKSGLFALLFGGAQITSCSVLSNQIQSQNLYQGVRFWAIFVFFDVPPYQRISNQTKNFVVPSVESRIRNAQQIDSRSQSVQHSQNPVHSQSSESGRRLFSTDQMYWRFQRTGQTSFFIYDCYVTIFLLVLCWLSILVLWRLSKGRWYAKHASKVYSAVHKVHEVSLMYVTMAAVVEFTYFQASSAERWVSAGVCLLFNVYFVAYQLFVYYELLRYPLAEIGNAHYDYFVVRYGCFLKNIRYADYEIYQKWSPADWFRPYNFHVLSYYKKFAMMVALPLFYSATYAQMGTLFAIQMLEVLRVWFVWPFVSRVRNWLRLSLEIALALFFLVNIVQISLIEKIQGDDISKMGSTISLFYGLGWTGFLLCFYFNFAHVAIGVYDFLVGLNVSTRAKMDNARRKYYYQKVKQYQKQNDSASKQVVNKWIKLGNLNGKICSQMPQINIRIEEYCMRMTLGKFQLSVRKIRELKMMSPRRHYKKNNMVTTKKYQKQALLDQAQNSSLYKLFYRIYTKYANNHIKTVVLKTFLNVFQQDFQQGEAVPFLRTKMFQKVQLISYENQSEERELENLLQGFPIPLQSFQNF